MTTNTNTTPATIPTAAAAAPATIPTAAVDALRTFVAQLTAPGFEALANTRMPCGRGKFFDVMLALLNQVAPKDPPAAPVVQPTPEVSAMTRQEASSAARAAAYGARDKVRDRDLSAAAAYNARGVACVMHAYSLSNDKGSLGARRTVAELARCVMAASDTYEMAYRDEGTLDAALEAAAALAWAITDVDAYVRQVGRSECY